MAGCLPKVQRVVEGKFREGAGKAQSRRESNEGRKGKKNREEKPLCCNNYGGAGKIVYFYYKMFDRNKV